MVGDSRMHGAQRRGFEAPAERVRYAPSTLTAKTDVGGLTVATRYSFRVRRVTKVGVADWTDPVSLVVG